MKKTILGLFPLMCCMSFVFGAQLTLSPEEWNLSENCIEDFSIYLNMAPRDRAITADIVLESNMEFVSFEKSDLFEYATPAYIDDWNIVRLVLFNSYDSILTEWWKIWTLYYNTTNVQWDPYIKYVFYNEWNTRDTNINIDGADILTNVMWWSFVLSPNKTCEILPSDFLPSAWENMEDMESFISDFESDHRSEKYVIFLHKYWRYLLWSFLFLVIVIILVLHRFTKKW